MRASRRRPVEIDPLSRTGDSMELIKRTTVEDVVNKRNAALASYADA